jgi:hypothetical protein
MRLSSGKLLPTVFWGSLLTNIMICCSAIPFILQPNHIFDYRQLVEVLFFQVIYLIGWPVPIVIWLGEVIFYGGFPDLGDLALVLVYPVGLICLLLTIFGKNNTWIPFVFAHTLIVISFIATWSAVIFGYNFMVG